MSNVRSFIVLAVTTWAFIVCFAVWLMFGVIGIPIRNELGSQWRRIWSAHLHPGVDRCVIPPAARYLDG
jgi:hypothetical protein